MAETPLEMTRRHVAEGLVRLERQRALIAKLETNGRARILPQANEFLAGIVEFQRDAEDHMRQEERKAAAPIRRRTSA